jgi:hypothetical protein
VSIPYFTDDTVTLWHSDAPAVLDDPLAASVDCVVTSPPYFGLWDYEVGGQLGIEESPLQYVAALQGCAGSVVGSVHPDPLYEDLYAGWDRAEIDGRTGQGNNASPERGGARIEVLWSNRPLVRQGELDLGVG